MNTYDNAVVPVRSSSVSCPDRLEEAPSWCCDSSVPDRKASRYDMRDEMIKNVFSTGTLTFVMRYNGVRGP
jgi:hypothetical protein